MRRFTRLLAKQARRQEKTTSSIRAELLKMVVDKLLIGLIVLSAGFFANRSIENFKADRSFQNEIAKTRVQKVGEVWERLYRYETISASSLARIMSERPPVIDPPRDDRGMSDSLVEQAKSLQPMFDARDGVLEAAANNRFWLGEEQYAAIITYLEASEAYTPFLDSINPGSSQSPEAQARRAALERARVTVQALAKQILGDAK